MLNETQTEKLIERITDLLANDEQFSAALPVEEVAKAMLSRDIGLAELQQVAAEGYADRPALGRRATELVDTGGRRHRVALPSYETISYRDLGDRVTALAAALHDRPVQPGDRLATLGAPSVDYTVIDMATVRLGGVSVPLHAGAPLRRLQPVVEETEPSVLACSTGHLATAVALCRASPTVVRLVVFDHHDDVDDDRDTLAIAREQLEPTGGRVVVETTSALVGRGNDLPVPPLPLAQPERLAAIIYTSGSSGSPKGAMQPERLVSVAWTYLAAAFIERGISLPAITLNYLPMSHTGGRAMLFSSLGAGGTACTGRRRRRTSPLGRSGRWRR
jgi:fatty acid CoA ligase FadD9